VQEAIEAACKTGRLVALPPVVALIEHYNPDDDGKTERTPASSETESKKSSKRIKLVFPDMRDRDIREP